MIREEIWNGMGIVKTTASIERGGLHTVTCTNLHNLFYPFVLLAQICNKSFTITMPLE